MHNETIDIDCILCTAIVPMTTERRGRYPGQRIPPRRQVRIQDLCRGGASEILPTSRSGVTVAAKFGPQNWGSGGGAPGPPGPPYICT